MKLKSASAIFLYPYADVTCLQITKKICVHASKTFGRLKYKFPPPLPKQNPQFLHFITLEKMRRNKRGQQMLAENWSCILLYRFFLMCMYIKSFTGRNIRRRWQQPHGFRTRCKTELLLQRQALQCVQVCVVYYTHKLHGFLKCF